MTKEEHHRELAAFLAACEETATSHCPTDVAFVALQKRMTSLKERSPEALEAWTTAKVTLVELRPFNPDQARLDKLAHACLDVILALSEGDNPLRGRTIWMKVADPRVPPVTLEARHARNRELTQQAVTKACERGTLWFDFSSSIPLAELAASLKRE